MISYAGNHFYATIDSEKRGNVTRRKEQNMKILSVTAQKPDSTGSGIYLTELVRGFDKKGIDQAVIAGITKEDKVILPERVKQYPVYFETEVLPFPITGMSDEMPYTSTKYSELTEEMTGQFRRAFGDILHKAVEELDPDVILCHHLYLLTAIVRELFPHRKVYGVSHGSDLRQIRKTSNNREYIMQMIPKLDGIFALHEEQKEIICAIYGEQIKEKVKVIGTGYNSEIFKRTLPGKKKDRKKQLKLIFAGKIAEKKGVKSLIRSLDYLRNSGLDISLDLAGGAGDAKEYEEIRELAQKSPFPVRFLGRITQQELAERISQSDVFVLPSFYEGLPLVIIEALACGAYVICTDLPGIQNWINQNLPDNGVVFVEPPKRVNEDEPVEEALPLFEKELSEAIESVALGTGKRPEKEHLERISWDGLCTRLMEVFESI